MISGANIIIMHTRVVKTTFKADLYSERNNLTKNLFPKKYAMKTERSTPVDLVKVAMPKKKQPQRAAESRGKL